MSLPDSPDTLAPIPFIDFVGTGRIYYPIPFATRLIRCGAFNEREKPAKLESLSIDVNFKNGIAQCPEMWVNYSWLENDVRLFSEMDLNEWQKLPPVPAN